MFDNTLSSIVSVMIHYVGNRLKEEPLQVSTHPSGMDPATEKQLWNYLYSAFKTPEFHRFTHPAELELNNVYSICRDIFRDPETFNNRSGALAKLLYEHSQHPNIKSGELFIIYFKSLTFGSLTSDAIGLFKSEKKQPFFFTEEQDETIDVFSYSGISPFKVDKACLVFNQDGEDGYQVLAVDNLNKGEEAKYWFDDFLKVKPRSTEYLKTSSILSLTKNFIEKDLDSEKPLERQDSIDLLNRSLNYFKESEAFDYDDFNEQVFQDEGTIDRFKSYAEENDRDNLQFHESFNIAPEAVKKKSRIFKSVLKLDKNFHVYIHGNREMIEKGTDDGGRKYYKLFYEEEN